MDKDKNLYKKGLMANIINLLIISPIYYTVAYNTILNNNSKLNFIKYFGLLIVQGIFYYYFHRLMHLDKNFKWIHEFHHEYTITVPTTGIAVSIYEFQLAYIFPFLIGALIFNPSIIDFNLSILTISLLNLIIHTNELRNLRYFKFLVSPNDHIVHHETRSNTYSAPIINIDNILKKN